MNATDALPDAAAVWLAPDDMVQMWRESDWKAHHETLVARWVGHVGLVADVGCGSGRFMQVIDWFIGYWGYDQSPRMIELARLQPLKLGATFACIDALAYSSGLQFDAVLMIDMAQHYPDPVGAIHTMLSHWQARRYFVSLVVGSKAEDLSATTVLQFEHLMQIFAPGTGVALERMWIEPFDGAEHLAWALLELRPI